MFSKTFRTLAHHTAHAAHTVWGSALALLICSVVLQVAGIPVLTGTGLNICLVSLGTLCALAWVLGEASDTLTKWGRKKRRR